MTDQVERISIVIVGQDQGGNAALQNLQRNLRGAQSASGGARQAFQSFTTGLTTFTGAVGIAGIAVSKLWDAAKEGAALELAEERFDRLTASIGTTSDALMNGLSQATSGMMSDAEMIASASELISLGLADNSEDVIKLATLVSELGWNMQQVILTFANNSKMRLDALGLSVEDVTNKAKALEEQGYSTDKAFDMAVIEAGEEKLELLGSAADTAVGDMARLEANLKNLGDTVMTGLAGPLADAAEAMSLLLTWNAQIEDALGETQTQIALNADSYGDYVSETTALWVQMGQLTEKERELMLRTVELGRTMEHWSEETNIMTRESWLLFNAVTAASPIHREHAAALEEQAAATEAAASASEWLDSTLEAAADEAAIMAEMYSEEVNPEIARFGRELGLSLTGINQYAIALGGIVGPLQSMAGAQLDVRGELERMIDIFGSAPDAEMMAYNLAMLSIIAAFERGELNAREAQEALLELKGAMDEGTPAADTYAGAVRDFGTEWANVKFNVDNTRIALQDLLIFLENNPALFNALGQRTVLEIINNTDETGGGGPGGDGGSGVGDEEYGPGNSGASGGVDPTDPVDGQGNDSGSTDAVVVVDGQELGKAATILTGQDATDFLNAGGNYMGT